MLQLNYTKIIAAVDALNGQTTTMAATGTADDIAQRIYTRCREQFSGSQLLYQRDILSLGIIPAKNLEILLECTQKLVDQNLFRVYQDSNNRLAWKVIAEEDAEK